MSEHEHKHEVKIFIDQQAYHSPNPTTGAALYALGKVEPGLELFREVTGDREDPEVPNGPEVIHLKEDEHFHSGQPKVYHIIVNGQQKRGHDEDAVLTTQIVALAFSGADHRAEHHLHGGLRGRPAQEPAGS